MHYVKRRNLYQQLQDYKYFFCIFLIFSCKTVQFTSKTSGQPKVEFYTFSNLKTYSTDPKIDTSVIYIYSADLIGTYKNGTTERAFFHRYLIFKKNGIVFLSNSSKDAFSQSNIYRVGGQYCFYQVENGELQLEMYDYNIKKFIILYGRISSDSILFYKDKLRGMVGGIGPQNMLFIKSSVMYSQPLIWPESMETRSSE